ncbi:MAG: divalent-cation tolerance protein CutA [Elusimicrobia bacterium]|nr:MAG: divalent-cation tolerance protein CutA [Elusimicrobiota bacterium]
MANSAESTPYSLVLVTCPSRSEGETLAEKLVEASMAACVNIIPGIRSIYRWEGKIEKQDEVMLTIKTRTRMIGEVTEFIKENHKYDVPEALAISIDGGNAGYLNWIGANTVIVNEAKEFSLPKKPSKET